MIASLINKVLRNKPIKFEFKPLQGREKQAWLEQFILSIPKGKRGFTSYFDVDNNYSVLTGNYESLIAFKDELLSFIKNGVNVIIIGEDRKGKTRLLENLFNKDDIIDCKEIFFKNSFNPDKALPIIFERIDKTTMKILPKISEEYRQDIFNKMDNAESPLIIDDDTKLIFPRMPEEYRKDLFEKINSHSQYVITFIHVDLFLEVRKHLKGELLVINLIGKNTLPHELME